MNRLKADLVLLIVALIWGSAFVVQRVATQHFDTFTFNGLRFLLGGLILLPFSRLKYRNEPDNHLVTMGVSRAKNILLPGFDQKSMLFFLLGGGLLAGSAGLQQLGLKFTTAGNAGFISSLYVVFVPLLLLLIWKVRISWITWIGAGVALLGSLLLSAGGRLQLARGDMLELAGALFAAGHVILVSKAVRHLDVLTFSSRQYIVAGVINLLVAMGIGSSFAGLPGGWWTIVFIGLISTAGGYTLQVLGQKYAPPSDATILLSMEAVFAALTGFIFLRERMELIQLVGCGLIISAVLVTQLKTAGARPTGMQNRREGKAGTL